MKITIGGQDFTSALDAAHPLTIERKLNEPSVCQLWITTAADTQIAITRNQPIQVTGDDGSFYFTGYIAASPLPEYAGLGMEGPRYRIALQAISDEYLLDQLAMAPGKGAAGLNAGPLVASLATKTGSAALSTQTLSLNTPVSEFAPVLGASFSGSAGAASNQARATYRALNGALTLSSVPAALHTLDETDGSLALANLTLKAGTRRAIANDITVCGQHEPTAYVTEYFLGDGVTSQFDLSSDAYLPPSSRTTIIRELFNEAQIDLRLWGNPGSHNYFSLGAGGLSMQGGTGRDGDTQLTWIDPVEMGGTLLLEACGVTLANGSTGILAGFYTGEQTQQGCIAGFQITAQSGTGAVAIQPIVLGSPAGSGYQVNPANQYSLRVRVHCPECERGLAVYRTYGDKGAITYGGQWNAASAKLQFEIQEYVNGVAGMPVTLYDGQIASLPGACSVVAASSINLFGSMRALDLTNLGSGWVVTTPANGSPATRRVGSTAQGAECRVESTGKLVFYTGFAPPIGEQIAVSYRAVGRATGRAVNAASQQALAQAGLPSVSAWIGSVTSPVPRSSQDCRNASLALAESAASMSALWSGTYTCTRANLDADAWPGDALELNAPSASLNAQVVVRDVKLTYEASHPDIVQYAINFSNDWADDLAIKANELVPADAWLPAPIAPSYLSNPSGLSVTSITGRTVTINVGTTAPIGGGFEIRRRDNCFMPGADPDLVMRGSQSNLTFTRVSASDRFFIRIYDGSKPPAYSEFSAALIFNLPLAS
ncbi:hypothetical protein P8935_05880 [Telmatobacter sp. DSM 110680]|uniref:Uncharacterized protein n=1 Tax=Telmatobacter sp. DSM 110680 TaxID=3036704 RepID=A0AAU7DP45_9BACT